MPKKITQKEFEATYKLAKQVYEQQLEFKDAIKQLTSTQLADEDRMNKNSAMMSIHFFRYMMNEKEYGRRLTPSHVRYYMEKVLQDYDKEGLRKFLNGLKLFINYRENSGLDALKFCELHNEFSKKIGLTSIF